MPKGSAIIADDAVTSAARDAGAREVFVPATRTARVALALAGGLGMGSAWLFPGSVMAAVLWSVATFVLATLALDRQRGQYGLAFLAGITGCALAFHWVFRTIADFSGLPDLVSAVLHALFLASAALQFVLFVFFARHLGAWAGRFALTTPIAWIAAETLMPRVFPWEPAHTQLAWLPLVQVAELAGSPLVGFLLFWLAEAVMRGAATRRWLPLALPALSLSLALGWGTYRLGDIRAVKAPQQKVALLQANMQIEQQGGVKRVGIDTQRYLDLTRQVNDPAALVVWPESALQAVVPADIGDRHRFERFEIGRAHV